jgi:hypothetical protein
MTDFGPTPSSFPVPPPPPPAARTGPPWENPGPALQRFIDTAKGVLIDPMVTFANMRREGGLGPPFIYYLVGMLIGILGLFAFMSMGFGGMPFMGGNREAMAGMAGAAVGLGILLVCCLAVATIGIFISSGITHLFLGLFGGQKFGYETTFRTVAYTQGSILPVLILPFCGSYIVGIWATVVVIIGLSQMQETTVGKSAAAVLVPYVVCCALGMILAMTFGALAFLGAAHAR